MNFTVFPISMDEFSSGPFDVTLPWDTNSNNQSPKDRERQQPKRRVYLFVCSLCNSTLSILYYATSNYCAIVGKFVYRSDLVQIKGDIPGICLEVIKKRRKPQSGSSGSWLRFQPSTFRKQVGCVTASVSLFDQDVYRIRARFMRWTRSNSILVQWNSHRRTIWRSDVSKW
jgi:hypothetical protein